MFDLYIFRPEVSKEFPASLLKRYGVVYSSLFKGMISFKSLIEQSPIAGFIARKISFGDLLDFDLPKDIKKLASFPRLPGEDPVDFRAKPGLIPESDR